MLPGGPSGCADSQPEERSQTPKLADLELRDSITWDGIRWTFERRAPAGRFVNGDWYMVGPVNVVAMDPKPVYDDQTLNGSMLNPLAVLHASAPSKARSPTRPGSSRNSWRGCPSRLSPAIR